MTKTNFANIDHVVGIDFGATFCGVSCSFTRDNVQRCCHITQWPRHKGFSDNQKVPAACLYDKKQRTFTKWGYDAVDHHKSSSKTQQEDSMILVQNFSKHIHIILESKTGSSTGVGNDKDINVFYKDAAVYFFRQMLQYAKKEKNRDIKHPLLLYVLSLPSNWSAVACNEMKQLFTEFILDVDDHFEIIQHSQAAVLYCQNGEPVILAPEESYLVCDLGGETSNFALFEPVNKQGETHGIFKIQDNENVESVISFGSSHIDKKMKEYISRVIFNNDDTDIAKSGSIVGHLMDFFIHSVKPSFGEAEGETTSIPLKNDGTIKPSTMASLTKDGTVIEEKLHISYEDMCIHVFDPVVDRVVASMERIIFEKSTRVAYIMTDKSSESYYLVSKIKKRLEQDNIDKVSNTSDEECASMDGAVFYGLNKVNRARKYLK